MPLQLLPETSITPAQDAAIKSLLCLAFPDDAATFSNTRAWNGSAPAFSVILEDQPGRGVQSAPPIIAHIGIVNRTLHVGQIPLRIAGIQNVAVHPHHRGKHLTAQLMAFAMREAARQTFDAGLLFCLPALEKLYARLGWITLPPTDVTRIHEGKPCPLPGKNIAMYYPLKLPAFPPGPIHLMGDDW